MGVFLSQGWMKMCRKRRRLTENAFSGATLLRWQRGAQLLRNESSSAKFLNNKQFKGLCFLCTPSSLKQSCWFFFFSAWILYPCKLVSRLCSSFLLLLKSDHHQAVPLTWHHTQSAHAKAETLVNKYAYMNSHHSKDAWHADQIESILLKSSFKVFS